MFQNPEKMTGRVRRLQFVLQYTTKIKYIKGVENAVADVLSRIDSYFGLNVSDQKVTDVFNQPRLKLIIADICAFKVPTLFTIDEFMKEPAKDNELKALSDKKSPLKFVKIK